MSTAGPTRARNLRRTTFVRLEPAMNPHLVDPAAHLPKNERSRDLYLIHEALARAQMEERMREAERERRAHHMRVAMRMRRRAESASLRARRALAIAVMQ